MGPFSPEGRESMSACDGYAELGPACIDQASPLPFCD
jgi:hypothetical protein